VGEGQGGGPLFIALTAGFTAGLAPLLLYNWHYFGHPLLVPNVAGNYADTFPFFNWSNFAAKLRFYATMLSLHVPVGWAGLAGLKLFPAALRREQLLIGAMLAALAGYVCNIETIGGCQYGPRYLLPAMPLLALGLIGFSHLGSAAGRRAAAVVATLLAVASGTINAVGTLYGAMYCDLRQYGFAHYLTALRLGIFRTFPLALWLTIPIGAWTVAVVRSIEDTRRQ
jgi:hypothetical protein